MKPAEGERRAVVGFSGQFGLAARVVYPHLTSLEWIRIADPEAGVADDFQFKAGPVRHALQVKWSQYPGNFTWSDLTAGPDAQSTGLFGKLADAWQSIRASWGGPIRIHLCTNDHPSSGPPPATSPLAQVVTSGPKHLAAFLERSVKPVQEFMRDRFSDVDDVHALAEYVGWSQAWQALKTLAALDDEDFFEFVKDLVFDMSVPTVEPDAAQFADELLTRQGEADVRALAAELQSLVADPTQRSHWEREVLLERLGWMGRISYHNRHDFPIPGTYVPNSTAQSAIQSSLKNFTGGYIGVFGPAGCGKSTLLSDLNIAGRVVRYYAFVPDSPDPLSGRGEAESFLADLSLALDEAGIRRATQPTGLPNLRKALQAQLDQAAEGWARRGERTVIIIDGLDHVAREQNPTRSMLEELPAPAALRDGVFIVLGSQSDANLNESIRAALAQEGRTLTVPSLTDPEARSIVRAAGLDAWLNGTQVDEIVNSGGGHPLALTYLVQEIDRIPVDGISDDERRALAARVLDDAASYSGDIELRYRGYYLSVRDDAEVISLLGVVSRLRTVLNIDWLKTWVNTDVLRRFMSSASTYFRIDGADWQFMHNSFRRFLVDESTRLAGLIDPRRDAEFHRRLADLCADSGAAWPLYRDEEIVHRFLAREYGLVLEIAQTRRLRERLLELQPTSAIADATILGLRAAAEADDADAFVSLSLFRAELSTREQSFESHRLADAMIPLLDAELGLDYVVRGGQLRVAANHAANSAAAWARSGQNGPASAVLNAIGGYQGVREYGPRRRGEDSGIADWAVATLLVSGLDAVLHQIDTHLSPTSPSSVEMYEVEVPAEDSVGADQARARQGEEFRRDRREVLVACFDELLETRENLQLDRLMALIDRDGVVAWEVRTRLFRAKAAEEDGDLDGAMRWIGEVIERATAARDVAANEESDAESSLRAFAATMLIRLGQHESPEFQMLVQDLTERPDHYADDAEKTYLSNMRIRTITEFMRFTASDTEIPGPGSEPTAVDGHGSAQGARTAGKRDPGRARLDMAVNDLAASIAGLYAYRLGIVTRKPDVSTVADRLIRVIEVPSHVTQDWTSWYRIRQAAPGLIERLVEHVHDVDGSAGLNRLASRFDSAWAGSRATYWSVDMRQRVLGFFIEAERAASEWVTMRLDDLEPSLELPGYDPEGNVSNWLRQAELRRRVGQPGKAVDSVRKAVVASLGLGQYQDEDQLAHWLAWLDRADLASPDERLRELIHFAARLPGANRSDEVAASTATALCIAQMWRISPLTAVRVGQSLCGRGVVDEETFLASVMQAAAQDSGSDLQLVATAVAQLLAPTATREWDGIRTALDSNGDARTKRIINRAFETWSLGWEAGFAGTDQRVDGASQDVVEAAAEDSPPTDDRLLDEPATVPTALLTQLRALPDRARIEDEWWNAAVDTLPTAPVSAAVARALLEQFRRLSASDRAIGALCSVAASVGLTEVVLETLQERLSQLPGSGWFRSYDGGSRRHLLESALAAGDPSITRLARTDLASTLASDAYSWQRISDDGLRVLEMTAGAEAVGRAWPEIRSYLDLLAPSEPDMVLDKIQDLVGDLNDDPTGGLLAMVALWIAHPAKTLEEGTRRIPLYALTSTRPIQPVAEAVIAAALARRGWFAESALDVLVLARPDNLEEPLRGLVHSAATAPDAILRDLAATVLRQASIDCPTLPHRDLDPGYTLVLPSLPPRKPPEVNREGIPYVDMTDPQQVIAPFDRVLDWVSELTQIPSETLIHKAAQLAVVPSGNGWTDSGPDSMASLLKLRGQRHGYRPWAYQVGRRAVAHVLADVFDAHRDAFSEMPSVDLGLTAPELLLIEPAPIGTRVPPVWDSGDNSRYDAKAWCDDAKSAAEAYKRAFEKERDFVLLEQSHWFSLDRERGEEERVLITVHRTRRPGIMGGQSRAIEKVHGDAAAYPSVGSDWDYEELVIRGFEMFSDAPFLEWIAFHPQVAALLGWSVDRGALFGWVGTDGNWRARTELLRRGQTTHRPRSDGSVGEVWRVVLSDAGLRELSAVLGPLSRALVVSRRVSESERSGQAAVDGRARVSLSGYRAGESD
jgi:hypothetical protein